MRTLTTLLTGALMAHTLSTSGNNISVSNTTLGTQNAGEQTIAITFDVAWENSWRTNTNESNHDGAWIFVKWRKANTYDWRHCTLHQSQSSPGTGATLVVPADEKGAFIHRTATGIGNVNFIGNQLTWRYGADGVLNNDSVEVKVFALEMVYIPEGPYYLGSGGSETNCFKDGNSVAPYLVNSNGPIPTGVNSGQLNMNANGENGLSIPESHPKGYNAFWIMKYECTHQQFADFLNLLTSTQASLHNISDNFNGSSYPLLASSVPDRAYHDLGIAQHVAFADWSGLRPFSEMEFEKACRGRNIQPVPNEYVWGTTSVLRLESNQFTNAGLPNEGIAAGVLANAAYRSGGTGPGRPVRVGIFARPSGATRELSGATYYGVLNMADNLYELTIRSGTQIGQSVDANTHGDGYLDPSGATDITAWQAGAFGARGTYWSSGSGTTGQMRTSHRDYMDLNVTAPSNAYGIRLARTAP